MPRGGHASAQFRLTRAFCARSLPYRRQRRRKSAPSDPQLGTPERLVSIPCVNRSRLPTATPHHTPGGVQISDRDLVAVFTASGSVPLLPPSRQRRDSRSLWRHASAQTRLRRDSTFAIAVGSRALRALRFAPPTSFSGLFLSSALKRKPPAAAFENGEYF